MLARFLQQILSNGNDRLPESLIKIQTIVQLQEYLMGRLAAFSGGRNGLSLLAPNSIIQFGHVIGEMIAIECMEIMQQSAMESYAENGALTTVYVLAGRNIVSAIPFSRSLSQGRMIFK